MDYEYVARVIKESCVLKLHTLYTIEVGFLMCKSYGTGEETPNLLSSGANYMKDH